MNVERIRDLVRRRTGEPTVQPTQEELAPFLDSVAFGDLRDYLERCLPARGYEASGVRVKSLELLLEENIAGGVPGRYVLPLGMLVAATSIGGNAVCFSAEGNVYWVDPQIFFDESTLSYRLDRADEWVEEPLDAQSLRRAVRLLSTDLEAFLVELLEGRLFATLEALD